MFGIFKQQIVKGGEVNLFLITGQEIRGTVLEIYDTHIIVNTDQGKVTVFEKILGGWVTNNTNEVSSAKINDAAKKLIFKGSLSEEQVSEELVSEELVSEEQVSEEQVSEEQVSEEQVSEELVSEELVSEELVSEELVSEELVSEGTLPKNIIDLRLKSIIESTPQELISEELVSEEPIPVDIYRSINVLLSDFKKHFTIAKLNQKPPSYSFPSICDEYSRKSEIKKEWDKINSLYQYYLKIKDLKQVIPLANRLSALGSKYSEIGAFNYNAGCFLSTAGRYQEAMSYFEKALESQDLPQFIYNIAYSALAMKDYNKAHNALAIYFHIVLPSSDENAWYVFCNLTEILRKYDIFGVIGKSVLKENKFKEDSHPSIPLLCKSILYFLNENKEVKIASRIASFLIKKNYNLNEANLLTNLGSGYLNRLFIKSSNPLLSSGLQDDKKLYEEDEIKKSNTSNSPKRSSLPERWQPQGYVHSYIRERNFGFLEDCSRTRYFFHRSAVIDPVLSAMLDNFTSEGNIPVTFETAYGAKGPIAIQISLYRTIDEMFELAINYANEGNYSKALAQIKKVMDLDPIYPNALKYHNQWKEYAGITGVPKGQNPYARARRAQLVEKDFPRAEQLFQEAISQKDHTESAIKDLASLLVQQDRHNEAIAVLEKNSNMIWDKNSFNNLLINIYHKSKQYDKAIELLNRKLDQTSIKEKRILIQWEIANSYLLNGNYIRAQQGFEDILKNRPDDIAAKRNIAICLSKRGLYDESERFLNKILDTSLDTKAAELLEAIIQARQTGVCDHFDKIITETILSEFSSELSEFAQFFLNRCDFQGVAPRRINEGIQDLKIYAGSEKDARYDIARIEEVAKQLGTRRPRERSSYYLSAARISQEVNDDPNQFYRYLCRSFASRGDAAVAETKHLDTAKEWYCEALAVYDGVRGVGNGDTGGEEQDAVNALVRLLYSTLGRAQIPTNPKIPSIDDSLEEILNCHPNREQFFGTIRYIILRSRYAANRILRSLYVRATLQALTLEYLKNKGISIPASINKFEDFVRLWNEERRKANDEIRSISSELQSLTQAVIATAWLENAIELIKGLIDRLFFDLDRQRARSLQKNFEYVLILCKQATFEEQERLSIQIDNNCKEMLKDIEENPTELSIEEIIPVVWAIQRKVRENLEKLYATSLPQLTLDLSIESYAPDNNRIIEIQIAAKNKIGCSPAESLELIVAPEEEVLFIANTFNIKLDESLRGGDQRILKIPLQVTSKAIESQTFSLPVYALYRSRSEDIRKTPIRSFSIRLYDEEQFEEIKNPYLTYAEGGVVANPAMFYGREDLIQNIVESIKNSKEQSKCIVIFGQKRSGKSSILYHLEKRLEKDNDLLVFYLGNLGLILDDEAKVPFLYLILWSILKGVETSIEKRSAKISVPLNLNLPSYNEFFTHPSPLVLFRDIFDNFMHQKSISKNWQSVRLVILIDEFSYIYEKIVEGRIPESFMKNWKALLQENYFNAVLAGPDVMHKFKQRFPNEFGTTQDERVSYLKPEDAIKLIDEPIRIGGSPGESRYRERAIDRILDLTAGSPFYIQILCNRLVEYMNMKHAMLVTEADVDHVKNELVHGVNALSLDKFNNLINSGDISKDAISDEDTLKVLKAITLDSRTGPCNRSSITCITKSSIDVILDDLVKRNVIEREREQYYRIKVGLFEEWLIANQ